MFSLCNRRHCMEKEDKENLVHFTNSNLYKLGGRKKWPIVYHPEYNISVFGIEKCHPFDAGKWGKIHNILIEKNLFTDEDIYVAQEATESDLLIIHSRSYLNSLKWSASVARIVEVPVAAFIPNILVQRKFLRPMRLQTGGSVMAGKLAMQYGWALNIGGGFHHCCATKGGGFCTYADITLLIKFVLHHYSEDVRKVLIVDLDAHQGNGHGRDFMDEDRVFVMDVYNRDIYPHDGFAKRGINRKVELPSYCRDDEYLEAIDTNLQQVLSSFNPDFVVYNAGTDVLNGDRLGNMHITAQGIIQRDELMFRACRGRSIPIVMVTSGGYQLSNAKIIADSILSLHKKGIITPDVTTRKE